MEEFIIQSKVLQAQHMQSYNLKDYKKAKYLKKYQIPFTNITINNNNHFDGTTYQNIKIVTTTKKHHFNQKNDTLKEKQNNKLSLFFQNNSKNAQICQRKSLFSSTSKFRKLTPQKLQKQQKKYKKDKNILKDLGNEILFQMPLNVIQKQQMNNTFKKCSGDFKQKTYQLEVQKQPSLIKKKLRTSLINETCFRKSIDITKSPFKTPSQPQIKTPLKSKIKSKQKILSKQKRKLIQSKRQFICSSVQNLRKSRINTAKTCNPTKRYINEKLNDEYKKSIIIGRLGTPCSKKSVRRNYYESNYQTVWKRSRNCYIFPQKRLSVENRSENLSNSLLEKQFIHQNQKQDVIRNKSISIEKQNKMKQMKKNRHKLCKTASIIPQVRNKFYNEPLCFYQWNAQPKKQKTRMIQQKSKHKYELQGLIFSFDVQNHVPLNHKEMRDENVRIMSKYSFNNQNKFNSYIQNLCTQSKF